MCGMRYIRRQEAGLSLQLLAALRNGSHEAQKLLVQLTC